MIPLAESLKDSLTIQSLVELAKSSGGYITGTIPESCDGKFYNTAVLVGSDGLVGFYRKIHLPNYEKRFFTAGDSIKTFDCKQATIGIMTCFDCWFAPLAAEMKQQGAEIICHSSNFGADVTPKVIPVRALENQCFVVSCNRIGVELFDGQPDYYRGESQIVSPDGKILFKAADEEVLAFVDINIDEADKPAFASLICDAFVSEHNKYTITLRNEPI